MKDLLTYSAVAAVAAGILALLFAMIKAKSVSSQDAGDETMQRIAKSIQEGAMAFLKAEYKVLAIFVVVVAGLLAWANHFSADDVKASVKAGTPIVQNSLIAISFVLGAIASGLAGWIGMNVATKANVRTTAAAKKSLPAALSVAFNGGTVMGMSVVGLAMVGLGALCIIYMGKNFFHESLTEYASIKTALNVLAGFSMGASSIALFARVGGGIYTKAADVGADLVGKVEQGLPEDSPNNPAVIADNVGDNVGDVAGMGADLFESYVGAIIGTMVLGLGFTASQTGAVEMSPIMIPLVIAACGIICSMVGTFFVRAKDGADTTKIQHALDFGAFGAAFVMAGATFAIAYYMWPGGADLAADPNAAKFLKDGSGKEVYWWQIGVATVIGLAIGVFVGMITSYYCSMGKKPVNSIAEQSKTGEATNIIAGLAVGMESTAVPMILISVGVVATHEYAGLYGVAIGALGMLSTTGIQLAVDAYGPIADNAGGIAEMSHQEPIVRERTDKLDAVGNTTAAIGKGFAIASAAMTALALFAAFKMTADIKSIDLTEPKVMAGIFIGGMLPFLFSSLAMKAVGNAAMDMIEEVRRQFREIPGLKEGEAEPDSATCVAISTNAAIKEMILPGLIAVIAPVAAGFYDKEVLGGMLAGVTVCGVLMAIFMSNAGGAWDNAKKSFEDGGFKTSTGEILEKGTPPHDAAVVGDTVGDPFKDTAGPSLNILVKLMSVIALVIAPLIK